MGVENPEQVSVWNWSVTAVPGTDQFQTDHLKFVSVRYRSGLTEKLHFCDFSDACLSIAPQ